MIIRQKEAEATSFPTVSGLSSAAAALDQAFDLATPGAMDGVSLGAS